MMISALFFPSNFWQWLCFLTTSKHWMQKTACHNTNIIRSNGQLRDHHHVRKVKTLCLCIMNFTCLCIAWLLSIARSLVSALPLFFLEQLSIISRFRGLIIHTLCKTSITTTTNKWPSINLCGTGNLCDFLSLWNRQFTEETQFPVFWAIICARTFPLISWLHSFLQCSYWDISLKAFENLSRSVYQLNISYCHAY